MQRLLDICRVWGLDVDEFPTNLQVLLIFTIYNLFHRDNFAQPAFEKAGEEAARVCYRAEMKAMVTWISLLMVMTEVKDFAVAVLWTESCGPILAVLTEPLDLGTRTLIATPSSYVDEAEGGCLILSAKEIREFKKIGIGVSGKIKPRYRAYLTLRGL